MWMKTFSLMVIILSLISISLAIKPSLISDPFRDEHTISLPSTLTCSNLVDYMDECFEDFSESGLVPFKGGKSCSQRIPYCFKKRMEMGALKMDSALARCLDNFKYGSECNTTSLYDKCCRLPFQESGGCPPINYGTCEFTTCNPFGVQCNSAFRCVAPIGLACDTDSDCIQGLYCTNCVCSVTPPVGPPSTTPVEPPITPPLPTPIAPPIPTPISPPVAPLVPVVNCTDNNVQSVILEQCQINCGSDCSICGQVWTFCVENGFILANYTISACLTIELDSIPTGLGLCPFNATLTSCCDNVLPPVTPPIVVPASPPIIAPISPPIAPVPPLDCLDNSLITTLLETCQVSCGAGCQYCGQVFSFCKENGIFGSNYTLDTCMTVSLDYTLVSSGCNYNASLNTCCDIPQPPFTPPLNCLNNDNITQVLLECEAACGSACSSCGDVFSYCEINGYFTINQTLDTCMTVTLDYLPIAGGCPYNTSLTSCCGLPGPAPETCINNTAVEERLISCQTECGTDCPFCGDVFSYCVFNGNISTNFTVNACATINLDYISTGLGVCPFATTLTTCCSSLIPPIAPPVFVPVAPPVTPAELVDCLDNLAVTALLDACQVACGAGCDYCGQVFSYCAENGFIAANYTLSACNVIYLDFIPTTAGACPFNDTLTFCCAEPEPPVPVIPVAPPITPPSVPLVDCTDNPTIVTTLDACQTLCSAECDYCGQVYTYCSDAGLLAGNFTIDACLVINLDFIPTTAGACPFNATLTSCCGEVEPPVPVLTKSKSNGGKVIKENKHDWDEAKCSLSRYAEAHYCMMAYQDLSCEDRLKKCQEHVVESVESDESKQCLMNKVSQSKDREICHFDRAITSCCK
jgi:hypothetical protein